MITGPAYEDILRARGRIAPHVIRTPLVYSHAFSALAGADIYLKLETLQKAGSFKVRGATNRILGHLHEIGEKGVVAASAGNHAQGVAVAAGIAGVPSTIVMPVHASLSKQAATKGYGARIILDGNTLADSIRVAEGLAHDGMTFIHPYNDPDVIAGQGTVGLEILEDDPAVDTIVVPVGGGGLISGIALAVKATNPGVRVIGVEAEACPSVHDALLATGVPGHAPAPSLADGIIVPEPGRLAMTVIGDLVDEIVLVSEEEIIDAMLFLLERKKIVAEGAGATPAAALLGRHITIPANSNTVLVISGGNIDSPLLSKVIARGLMRQGRTLHVNIELVDRPGSLAGLLAVISRSEGNISHIGHHKDLPGIPFDHVVVDIEMETRGPDHSARIMKEITGAGFRNIGPD